MIDAQLRDVKEQVLQPLAMTVGKRLHPTTITLVGGGIGIVSAVAAGFGWFGLGLVLWIVNRVLDGLDGTVARLTNRQSALGGYIDIMVDFFVYAAVPIGLIWSQPLLANVAALVFLLATFYLNAASYMYLAAILEKHAQGAAARGEKTSVTMPVGWVEGAETVAFYILFFIFPYQLALLFGLMGVAMLITVGQRIIWAVNHLD